MSVAHPAASYFLLIGPIFFLAGFGLPLLIAPVRWARWFGWWIPADVRLVRYLGRSLGAVVVPLMLFLVRAAPVPEAYPWLFELAVMICSALAVVHLVGAVERSQPWTEHVEIFLYAAVAIVAAVIRTGLP